ncbi:hypothetical protein CPB83DRAFT_890317 [Crepidotus variabilis]|uniref:Uncharacterized protein n=1 Tax=Crepidotus variabilis TaxID=179855 RepID=A0A9P6ER76_9AGAR|nr:hypothetical protein CPB83DRAFT_890317 [Crepidotus variabilis]
MSNKKSTSPGASGSHSPSISSSAQSRSPPPKLTNVFTDDGSFLDRIRRSMKSLHTYGIQEEEDKKKDQTALERKKNFADRFKNRGKRPALDEDVPIDVEDGGSNTEGDGHKAKKVKLSDAVHKESEKIQASELASITAQEDYQRAVSSYNESLKDKGTGIRPLAK